MARITRKQLLKEDEFVETAQDFGHWLEENWQTAARWAGIVLATVLIVVVAVAWMRHRAEQASDLLAGAISRYVAADEAGFPDPAELDETLAALDRVIGRAGGSAAGRSARFYRGATLYRLGRLDESVAALEPVADDASSLTLAASAQALLATVLVEAGDADRAIQMLDELANGGREGLPADQALLRLGRIHNARGETEAARRAWERIAAEFPTGAAVGEANRLLTEL